MNLRFGTKEDIVQIGPVIKSSWTDHVDHEPEFLNREALFGYDLNEYFADCFNGSDKSFLLIVEIDGKMVGFAKADVQELQKFFKPHRALYVDDLYTLEPFRGKGVSKFLLAEAEKLAREKGIKWLKGRVYTWNKPAQKTVESAGFKNMYSEWFKVLD